MPDTLTAADLREYDAWVARHAGDNPESDVCSLADWQAAGEWLAGVRPVAAGAGDDDGLPL